MGPRTSTAARFDISALFASLAHLGQASCPVPDVSAEPWRARLIATDRMIPSQHPSTLQSSHLRREQTWSAIKLLSSRSFTTCPTVSSSLPGLRACLTRPPRTDKSLRSLAVGICQSQLEARPWRYCTTSDAPLEALTSLWRPKRYSQLREDLDACSANDSYEDIVRDNWLRYLQVIEEREENIYEQARKAVRVESSLLVKVDDFEVPLDAQHHLKMILASLKRALSSLRTLYARADADAEALEELGDSLRGCHDLFADRNPQSSGCSMVLASGVLSTLADNAFIQIGSSVVHSHAGDGQPGTVGGGSPSTEDRLPGGRMRGMCRLPAHCSR